MAPKRYRYVDGRLIPFIKTREPKAESPLALPSDTQKYAFLPKFELENGTVLRNVRVAYTAHGNLNLSGNNVIVVCHALSGNADAKGDWWTPLFQGSNASLDLPNSFIVCLNVLGSPYGTTSPLTFIDDDPASSRWGVDFPRTSIRDDVHLHKQILDMLGVKQVAMVVGGSMGGMQSLEWAFLGQDYVRAVVVIACSATQSAWGIAWNEMQRAAIRADVKFLQGYYSLETPPKDGLAAARMAAMLTYRAFGSYQRRFNRDIQGSVPRLSQLKLQEHTIGTIEPVEQSVIMSLDLEVKSTLSSSLFVRPQTKFAAQSYLDYQGRKFNSRFDANCYIALTEKLDTHDIARGRAEASNPRRLEVALGLISQPVLVVGIEGDVLYPFEEQIFLSKAIPNARLECLLSDEGHDAFLLDTASINRYITDFVRDIGLEKDLS